MAAYGDDSLRHRVPASNRPRRQLFVPNFGQFPRRCQIDRIVPDENRDSRLLEKWQ